MEQRSLSRYLIAIICVLVAGWRLTEMVCTSRCLPGENVVNYGEGEILPRRREFFKKLLLKILTVRCSLSFDDISLRFTFTFCEVEEKHHKNFPVVCRT